MRQYSRATAAARLFSSSTEDRSPSAPVDAQLGSREQPGELRCAAIKSAPKSAVIHGHQLQENIEILDGVMGRGKKRAEHDRPAQDQGLAAFPIGPEGR